MKQPEKPKSKKSKSKSKGKGKKNKNGRPKGSRNKNRRDVEFTEFQNVLQVNIKKALTLIGDTLQLAYFVYDGALGHNGGVQLVRQCNLHLISKLRYDSALRNNFV